MKLRIRVLHPMDTEFGKHYLFLAMPQDQARPISVVTKPGVLEVQDDNGLWNPVEIVS